MTNLGHIANSITKNQTGQYYQVLENSPNPLFTIFYRKLSESTSGGSIKVSGQWRITGELDRHELSIAQAAKFLHVSRQTLSKLCNDKCPCSLDLASRISTATGSTVALWINLQAAYNTWQAEQIEHPEATLFPQEQVIQERSLCRFPE